MADDGRARTYDVHAHCVPDGLLSALEKEGRRFGAEVVDVDGGRAVRFAGGAMTSAVRPGLDGVERRLASMDEARVDVQLVSTWMPLTGYTLPAAEAARYARVFNELLTETVGRAPDRLRGLCNVPLQHPELAARELEHAVGELGMVGCEIATTVAGRELDDRTLDPFWSAAAELRAPVLMHPFSSLKGRDLPRHHVRNLVGNPAESTIAIAHVILGGVLERFPDLRLVMVHGGGFAPWQVGRWDRGYAAVAEVGIDLSRSPSEWLRTVHFDTVLHDPGAVGRLLDWAGPDRVVLGSDYPFPMGDLTPVDTVDAVGGLSDEVRAKVLGGNVERLLAEIRR